MSQSRLIVLAIVLFLAAAVGCASPAAVYGHKARYSPAFRGYVMAAENGSDDPGEEDTVLLLRDPVTGTKLRCREEVLEWRELHEDIAVAQMRDHRAAIASGVVMSVLFAPAVSIQPLGGLVVIEGLQATKGLYNLLRTKNATELLEAGIRLYERERFPQSAVVFEHALAKDGNIGSQSKVYYYLGLAYAEQGKDARARLALTAFVDRSTVRDVDGYREAEATLKSLGFYRRPCASTGPVELHW